MGKKISNEDKIMGLIKNASLNAYTAFKSSSINTDNLNTKSLHLRANNTKNSLGSVSSYVSESTKEITLLVEYYNKELKDMIKKVKLLDDQINYIRNKKVKKGEYLSELEFSFDIENLDTIDITNENFINTIKELEKSLNFAISGTKFCSASIQSSDNDKIRGLLLKGNSNCRSSSKYANLALNNFKTEYEVIKELLNKYHVLINKLSNQINLEKNNDLIENNKTLKRR